MALPFSGQERICLLSRLRPKRRQAIGSYTPQLRPNIINRKLLKINCPISYNYLELVGQTVDCPNATESRTGNGKSALVRGRASCERAH